MHKTHAVFTVKEPEQLGYEKQDGGLPSLFDGRDGLGRAEEGQADGPLLALKLLQRQPLGFARCHGRVWPARHASTLTQSRPGAIAPKVH